MAESKDAGVEEKSGTVSYDKDQRTWAMLCHISAFTGFVFPFGNIIAPLVLWLLKKDEYPLVDDQGKEALNFQISMCIYVIGSIILVFMLIGIPLLIGLVLFDIVVTIIAAVRSMDGEKYRYPLAIRFVN